MSGFALDFRTALRSLRRSPTLTVTAVLILGLGIGMSVAMWTVLHAVLLRPLPVLRPDRIVFDLQAPIMTTPTQYVVTGMFGESAAPRRTLTVIP